MLAWMPIFFGYFWYELCSYLLTFPNSFWTCTAIDCSFVVYTWSLAYLPTFNGDEWQFHNSFLTWKSFFDMHAKLTVVLYLLLGYLLTSLVTFFYMRAELSLVLYFLLVMLSYVPNIIFGHHIDCTSADFPWL